MQYLSQTAIEPEDIAIVEDCFELLLNKISSAKDQLQQAYLLSKELAVESVLL
jgi:hypothetical protein